MSKELMGILERYRKTTYELQHDYDLYKNSNTTILNALEAKKAIENETKQAHSAIQEHYLGLLKECEVTKIESSECLANYPELKGRSFIDVSEIERKIRGDV